MLKLVYNDNGLGMYCYQFIWKGNMLLFVGFEYFDLLEICFYYIGGIIKYVKVINVFINLIMNSYKCLVFGFEVFVLLVYLVWNCLVFCWIFFVLLLKGKWVEIWFLDVMVNLYFVFFVMLMVGIDGIENKIYLGDLMDKDFYDFLFEELQDVFIVCGFLREVFENFDVDCGFLMKGGVFDDD